MFVCDLCTHATAAGKPLACEVLQQETDLYYKVWFGTYRNSWLSTHLVLCFLHYPVGWQRDLIFPNALGVGLAACTPRCTPRCCASFSSAHGQESHALLEQTEGWSKRASRESTCLQGELVCKEVAQPRTSLILFHIQDGGCPCSSLQCSPRDKSVNTCFRGSTLLSNPKIWN